MKVEDLMVGNWFYHKDSKYPFRVGSDDYRYSFDWAIPIPLTEENIVELLGFEKNMLQDGIYAFYYKNEIIIDWDYKIITINENECTLPKHVHELQQLIKSLEE